MSYPLCQAPEHLPHQILKRGHGLLCANRADLTPIGVTRGRGLAGAAAPDLSTEHGPLRAARSCYPAVAAALGLSIGHGPLLAARSRSPAATTELRWTCGPDSSTGG
jgi:hypothetical protein